MFLERLPMQVATHRPPSALVQFGCSDCSLTTRLTTSLCGMLTNRSAPPATVTPVLVYEDVRAAVTWLQSAFGFEERVRIGEGHRAQLRVGSDGAVVVVDAGGDRVAPSGGGVTHIVKVRVPDVDAAFARAREAGARVVEELTTWEYGERSGVVEVSAATAGN